jgi:hypothetical protein
MLPGVKNKRAIQRGAIGRELRSVAGAVPAALETVPVQVTSKVRAGRRAQEQLAVLVAIGRNLAHPFAHDRALPGFELIP